MRSWTANLLGAGAAACVLGAGFLVGAPDAEANAPSSSATLAAPARAVSGDGEIALGDSLELWGQPSRLNMFWTPDATDSVTRIYQEAWDKAGLQTSVQRIDKVTTVSALEESTGLMRTVTVLDGGGEERLVLPGITDMRSLPDPSPQNAPIPIPETAKAYLAHTADDLLSVSYSATFLVPLRPERVVRFYEVNLLEQGYEPKEGLKASGPASAAEWTRGRETITVAASALGEGANIASFTVVTHQRALGEEELP